MYIYLFIYLFICVCRVWGCEVAITDRVRAQVGTLTVTQLGPN